MQKIQEAKGCGESGGLKTNPASQNGQTRPNGRNPDSRNGQSAVKQTLGWRHRDADGQVNDPPGGGEDGEERRQEVPFSPVM